LQDYKEVERFAEVVRGGLVLCFRRLIKKAIAEERFEVVDSCSRSLFLTILVLLLPVSIFLKKK
jgi:hypothetical protein